MEHACLGSSGKERRSHPPTPTDPFAEMWCSDKDVVGAQDDTGAISRLRLGRGLFFPLFRLADEEVFEMSDLLAEAEVDRAGGAVAVLGENDLRDAGGVAVCRAI